MKTDKVIVDSRDYFLHKSEVLICSMWSYFCMTTILLTYCHLSQSFSPAACFKN